MKKVFSNRWFTAFVLLVCAGLCWRVRAQVDRLGEGKNFKFPDYYPSTNGVSRTRSIVTGAHYRFVSNTVIALGQPRVEFFKEDGATMEWTAIAREAIVNINTRELHGPTNMFFRTADDSLFLTGVGFLWQQSNSVLILSNKSFAWIDTRNLSKAPAKNSTKKMKALVAATLVATGRLTAAELEMPPARPGLTINADVSIMMLKSNIVIFSNNVVVIDPPSKPGEAPTVLKCGWLTGKRDANGRVEEISAHERVSIDQGDLHARGNYAVYTATNELMALVGAYDPADTNHLRPYLFTSQNTNTANAITNSGEAIIYDRLKNTLTTLGGAKVVVPATALKTMTTTNPGAVSPLKNRVIRSP